MNIVNLEFGYTYCAHSQWHVVESIDRSDNTCIVRVFASELEADIYSGLLWEELSNYLNPNK